VGYDDHDVSLPPLGRGCARRFAHPEVVLGRTHGLSGKRDKFCGQCPVRAARIYL
jgi:hypothetical protein